MRLFAFRSPFVRAEIQVQRTVITQAEADALLGTLKEAVRDVVFEWLPNTRQEELMKAVGDEQLQFHLNLSRNPFEIRLHLRTKGRNIGLLRIDAAPYHQNPDGTELINTPHIHRYREDYDPVRLPWAEPINWHEPSQPLKTLLRFLEEANATFPSGIQLSIV